MQPDLQDAAYLWDMLEASREVVAYTTGLAAEDYLRDRMRQRAVERAIEIIGEAARRVSEKFKRDHAEIPWQQITAQRNVLAHEYGEIVQERIWHVAVIYIPELIGHLEPLIPPLPPQP